MINEGLLPVLVFLIVQSSLLGFFIGKLYQSQRAILDDIIELKGKAASLTSKDLCDSRHNAFEAEVKIHLEQNQREHEQLMEKMLWLQENLVEVKECLHKIQLKEPC